MKPACGVFGLPWPVIQVALRLRSSLTELPHSLSIIFLSNTKNGNFVRTGLSTLLHNNLHIKYEKKQSDYSLPLNAVTPVPLPP